MSARRHSAAPRTSCCPVLTSPVIGTLVHARDRMDRLTRLGFIRFFTDEHGLPSSVAETLMRAFVPSLLAYINDPEHIVQVLRRCVYGNITFFDPVHNGERSFRAADQAEPNPCAFLLPHPKLPIVLSCHGATRVTILKHGTPGTQASTPLDHLPIAHYYDALSMLDQDALTLQPSTHIQTPRQQQPIAHHFFLFKINYLWWRTEDPAQLHSVEDLVNDPKTPHLPPVPPPYDPRQPGIMQRMFHLPRWNRQPVGVPGQTTRTPRTLTINDTAYKFPPALAKILDLQKPLLASAEDVTQHDHWILPVDNAMLPELIIPAQTVGTPHRTVPKDELPRTSYDRNRPEHERTLDIALKPTRYAEDRN